MIRGRGYRRCIASALSCARIARMPARCSGCSVSHRAFTSASVMFMIRARRAATSGVGAGPPNDRLPRGSLLAGGAQPRGSRPESRSRGSRGPRGSNPDARGSRDMRGSLGSGWKRRLASLGGADVAKLVGSGRTGPDDDTGLGAAPAPAPDAAELPAVWPSEHACVSVHAGGDARGGTTGPQQGTNLRACSACQELLDHATVLARAVASP